MRHPFYRSVVSSPLKAANSSFTLPDGVNRYGEYETAAIRSPLDSKVLFEVTSPTILNRDKVPDDKLPIEIRASEVNERLWRVLSRTIEAKQPPTVAISTLNKHLILQISDGQSTRPIRLVTVTEPDADFNGKPLDELAEEWKKILQAEMVRFKQMTAPEVLRQRIGQASQILLGLLVSSGVIWLLRRSLTHQQNLIETRYQQQLDALVEEEKAQQSEIPEETEAREIANLRSRFLATLQHQFSLKRQLDFNKFLKWALLWIFILMWYVGIAHILSIVPVLMRWGFYLWATPVALLILWFGISLAIRISKSLIDRLMHSWKQSSLLPLGEAQRVVMRSTTIAEALKGLITFVLVMVGIIWTLDLFSVPTSSILAGGAVIGLAISFGSQSLIKDLVNGCLILVEDQFAVGDVIQIDQQSGLVENLNLRVTQLRNSEGHLITIPNSTIANVCNLTRLWSRIDFSIVVAYENDPKRVLDVLKQVSQQMYDDPQWRDRIPELPEVLGIDDLSHTGMLVRVWIKTAPMEQWSVGREFRLRVRQAFEANQIQIGKPQLITYHTDFNKIS
ncbi:mechanosensitive ion channel family protein [Leptolyngbya sp. FACHB-402]|nr:mechanosensitive ion channel family protein [Leptolyngbya sp. FACHB-161]MBD2378040.1 mechanosensitive ion channel family protein [Leptolyngbya sp. FACHB-238]MBD2402460.1 mechanosensitive ion channel family protein [Leptolyngbya sp. FACHB-239]MBD2408945.1 mechanosensitive ion channel family protein [Leptolyngbya sp. FACHB-402]